MKAVAWIGYRENNSAFALYQAETNEFKQAAWLWIIFCSSTPKLQSIMLGKETSNRNESKCKCITFSVGNMRDAKQLD